MNRVKTYKRFGIYQHTEKEMQKDDSLLPFEVFAPGVTPQSVFLSLYECDSLHECMSYIDSFRENAISQERMSLMFL